MITGKIGGGRGPGRVSSPIDLRHHIPAMTSLVVAVLDVHNETRELIEDLNELAAELDREEGAACITACRDPGIPLVPQYLWINYGYCVSLLGTNLELS